MDVSAEQSRSRWSVPSQSLQLGVICTVSHLPHSLVNRSADHQLLANIYSVSGRLAVHPSTLLCKSSLVHAWGERTGPCRAYRASLCCALRHMSGFYAGKGLFAPKAPFWEKPTFLLYTAAQVCSGAAWQVTGCTWPFYSMALCSRTFCITCG